MERFVGLWPSSCPRNDSHLWKHKTGLQTLSLLIWSSLQEHCSCLKAPPLESQQTYKTHQENNEKSGKYTKPQQKSARTAGHHMQPAFFSLRVPGLENDWFASMVPPRLVGWTGPGSQRKSTNQKTAPFESSHRCWHHLSNEYCTLALGTSYHRQWLWRFESGIQFKVGVS